METVEAETVEAAEDRGEQPETDGNSWRRKQLRQLKTGGNSWKPLESVGISRKQPKAAGISRKLLETVGDRGNRGTETKGPSPKRVNRDTGRVLYRGSHSKYTRQKDSLSPQDTYTFSGAKKALSNLERLYPDGSFYSIEKLSCYYIDFDSDTPDKKDYIEEIFADIEHAMVRLDELWEGNDFHRGDKMRINEVRAALKRIKERLLGQ